MNAMVMGWVALLALLLHVDSTWAAPHTVEELLKRPHVRGADLSPDGAYIALAFRDKGQEGDVIGVIDTARIGQPDAVRRFTLGKNEMFSVEWIRWVTPERMLIGVSLGNGLIGSRVCAVNRDGSQPTFLFSNAHRFRRMGYELSTVIEAPESDPGHVLMPGWTGHSYDLFRVDIATGEAIRIVKGNASTFAWDTEEGRPALRYDINLRGTVVSVYGRADDARDWDLITRYRRDIDTLKYWVRSIGDPKQDAALLRAGSPRLRAAEIRIPVLLIHGAQDDIVPIEQSKMMHKALRKAGKPVKLITYEGEGHRSWSYSNDVRMMNEVIAFLRPHLESR